MNTRLYKPFSGFLLFFAVCPLCVEGQERISYGSPVQTSNTSSYHTIQDASLSRSLQDFVHHEWQTEQGLPQNGVYALCQTRDGYLWIGTVEGLVRFDGVQFTVFNKATTPVLRHDWVYSLREGADGTLWIGTLGGGVSTYSRGVFAAFSDSTAFPSLAIRCIFQDRTNTLWFGTDKGLVSFANGQMRQFSLKDGLHAEIVRAVAEDSDGRIWVGLRNGGVQTIERGNIVGRTGVPGLPANAGVHILYCDKAGRMFAGTSGGAYVVEHGRFRAVSAELSNLTVQSMFQDASGTMWFGTTSGLIRLVENTVETMDNENALGKSIILSLTQDREGTIWIGTGGSGLHRLHIGTFTTLRTSPTSALRDNIFCVAEDAAGTLWTGGINGIRWFRNGLESREKLPVTRSADKSVYALLPKEQGMWVGSGNGLHLYSPLGKRLKSYTTADGLSNNVVLSLAAEGDSVIWVGTQGGVNRLQRGRWTHFSPNAGLSGNTISALHLARDGTLWIGTWDGGVSFIKNGVVTRLSAPNLVIPKQILAFWEESDGKTLWISSFGGGLLRLRHGAIAAVTSKHGLFNDVAYSMLPDSSGYIWMSCNKGIFRVRLKELNDCADGRLKQCSSEVFGVEDGMKNAECNGGTQPSAWQLRGGMLAFATIRGIALAQPARIVRNSLPPTIAIERVVADSRILGLEPHLSVSPETERIEIHYTATSLRVPENVRFRYMLEGYDKVWIDAARRRVAYYTNLPRGRTYRFRVMACNNDGVWNEREAVLTLAYTPYFWETWWAYSVYALFGAFSIAAFMRFRDHRHRHRLREKFREREAELIFEKNLVLEETNTRLESLNRQLQEANSNLAMLNEEKIDILGVVAHDLKNPIIGIQKLSYSLEGQARKAALPQIQESAGIIKHSAERMFAMIQQLLKVHAAEYGQESLTPIAINLVDLIEQLVRDWAIRARQRSVELRVVAEASHIYALADPFAFLQILENLLSNALKASPLNAVVEIHCFVQKGGTAACVAVRDSGIGMSEEQQSVLFTKFILLRGRTKAGLPSEEHSTGLGLYIVKKLTEAMSGTIHCESSPNLGSTFTLILPSANKPTTMPEV